MAKIKEEKVEQKLDNNSVNDMNIKDKIKQRHIVIIGGGIIGCTTAYYLITNNNDIKVTIIERESIACAASGKAGGFLAKDWCDGGWMGPLARESYKLHEMFGKKYGKKTLYRNLKTYDMKTKKSGTNCIKQNNKSLSWIDCNIESSHLIGTNNSTAQIHPKYFCELLIELCKPNIIYGTVTRVLSNNGTANHVEYIPKSNDNNNNKSKRISFDDIVIAMGPWSYQAYQWFPECKQLQYVNGSKHNSIVIKPENFNDKTFPDHAIFLDHYSQLNNTNQSCEIYPRIDGTIYSCGKAKKTKLPANPNDIKCDEYIDIICNNLKELSIKHTFNCDILIKQACYIPLSKDGNPLIGKINTYNNVYIGCGHSCWGILNGPITGKLLSELIIFGKVKSVKQKDFVKLNPNRG